MNGRLARWILLALFLTGATIYIYAKSLLAGLNHDEHQFVMPGILLLENGLLPYRDYPHFHVPYLSFLQGFIAHFSGHKLVAIRLLSGTFVLLTLIVLVSVAHRFLRGSNAWIQWSLTILTGTAFLAARVTESTIRYAWNHAPPLFLSVLAFWLVLTAADRRSGRALVFLAGVALSLATGMRISFLLLFAPFGLALVFLPGTSRRIRFAHAGWFSFGALLVAVPFAWLLIRAPEQAVFGNFQYPKLSNVWRQYPFWDPNTATAVDQERGLVNSSTPVTGPSKWRDFRVFTIKKHVPLVLLICLLGLPFCLYLAIWRESFAARFLLLLIPFVWWGALLPSRFNPQYYLPLGAWMLLTLPLGASALPGNSRWSIAALLLVATGVGLQVTYTFDRLSKLPDLTNPKSWPPVIYHDRAQQLRQFSITGKVLTTEPLMAAEAGLTTYPEFANGEFAIRCAHILPLDRRMRLKMVSAYDLERFLEKEPPNAILIDQDDGKLNRPFEDYAQRHGYLRSFENDHIELWIPSLGK